MEGGRNVEDGALSQTAVPSPSDALPEQPRFSRPPLDRLFVGALVALTCVYALLLVVMELTRSDEDPAARQGHMGVVAAEPGAGGNRGLEDDPAAAVVETGRARRPGYYPGGSGRPIIAVVPGKAGDSKVASGASEPGWSATRSRRPPVASTSGTGVASERTPMTAAAAAADQLATLGVQAWSERLTRALASRVVVGVAGEDGPGPVELLDEQDLGEAVGQGQL